MDKNTRIQEIYILLLKKFGTYCKIVFDADAVYVKKKKSHNAQTIIIHYKNYGVPDMKSENEVILEFIKSNIDRQIPCTEKNK